MINIYIAVFQIIVSLGLALGYYAQATLSPKWTKPYVIYAAIAFLWVINLIIGCLRIIALSH